VKRSKVSTAASTGVVGTTGDGRSKRFHVNFDLAIEARATEGQIVEAVGLALKHLSFKGMFSNLQALKENVS
jgi:hypothetical protein